jgi:hypothetical protein
MQDPQSQKSFLNYPPSLVNSAPRHVVHPKQVIVCIAQNVLIISAQTPCTEISLCWMQRLRLTGTKYTLATIGGCGSRNVAVRPCVHQVHLCCFDEPVCHVVLNDGKRIDPHVSYTKALCCRDGFSERLWQLSYEHASAQGFHCVPVELDEFCLPSTMT